MKGNRILSLLLLATILMQAGILFKEYSRSTGARRPPPAVSDPPKDAALDVTGLPTHGDNTAKVVLVEFSDYECPFCERHANGVGKELISKFVMSGKIRHVFINNPLPIHPNARLLATAALCAGDQQNYWEMHDMLFTRKPKSREEVFSLATEAKLDIPSFRRCLDDEKSAKQVESDKAATTRLQFRGTPSFAIGIVDEQGQLIIKKLINGAQPFEVFNSVLTEILDESRARA